MTMRYFFEVLKELKLKAYTQLYLLAFPLIAIWYIVYVVQSNYIAAKKPERTQTDSNTSHGRQIT